MARSWFAVLLLLFACQAELDWRELRSEEGRFAVWLPARAFEESRPLTGRLSGVPMRQWSAKARDTLFAVGYADFDRLPPQILDDVRDALLANIAGKLLEEHNVSIPGAQGRELRAFGSAGDSALRLRLRLLASDARLYQIAVLGKPGDIPEAELDTFFESFKLTAAPR